MLSDELTCRDLFPLELLRKNVEVLLFVGAWCAKQENPLTSLSLDLLQDELERVRRAAHYDLPDQIFKQLVDLVIVQIRFNGLHEVHLLHFVHADFLSFLNFNDYKT